MTKMKEMIKRQEEMVHKYEQEINSSRTISQMTAAATISNEECKGEDLLVNPEYQQQNLIQIPSNGSANSNNPLIRQIREQLNEIEIGNDQSNKENSEQELMIQTTLKDSI